MGMISFFAHDDQCFFLAAKAAITDTSKADDTAAPVAGLLSSAAAGAGEAVSAEAGAADSAEPDVPAELPVGVLTFTVT